MIKGWKKRFVVLGMSVMLGVTAAGTVSQMDTAYAHSGRTDAQGGHRDNKNKSGLGSYHYHCGGNPPHLHDGGVCPYSSEAAASATESRPKESISVTRAPSEMVIGESSGFSCTIENGEDSGITVSSSDSAVIQVNKDHTLSAVGAGSATINVESANASTSFSVTVSAVLANSITIEDSPGELTAGEQGKLTAVILPENTSDKTIIWSSSDEKVVSVDDDGGITAVAPGESRITAAAVNGISAEAVIKVNAPVPVEISTDAESLSICINEKGSLDIRILPDSAENKEYTVKSEDESIVAVNADGTLQAVSEGETSIMIVTWNELQKKVPVEVYHIPVEQVEIDDSRVKYESDGKITRETKLPLTAKVQPEDATYQEITWTSSDEGIIEVVNGEFIIHKPGKVMLTAATSDGAADHIALEVVDKNASALLGGVVLLAGVGVGGGIWYRKKKNRN